MSRPRLHLLDVVGFIAGGVFGAIVAVNFVITVGIGYDVTPGDVFREDALVGVVTVVILLAGPIGGVLAMRRLRRGSGSNN